MCAVAAPAGTDYAHRIPSEPPRIATLASLGGPLGVAPPPPLLRPSLPIPRLAPPPLAHVATAAALARLHWKYQVIGC